MEGEEKITKKGEGKEDKERESVRLLQLSKRDECAFTEVKDKYTLSLSLSLSLSLNNDNNNNNDNSE